MKKTIVLSVVAVMLASAVVAWAEMRYRYMETAPGCEGGGWYVQEVSGNGATSVVLCDGGGIGDSSQVER